MVVAKIPLLRAISNAPRIGLGMAALGRPGYINLNRSEIFGDQKRTESYMQDRTNEVIDKALELGITWFDCARSYGLSEKFVGEYLRDKNISSVTENSEETGGAIISSKWGYTYVADWKVELEPGKPHEVKDHSVDTFLRQVEETNALVGDHTYLYQVHSATFESGILTDARVHEELERCKSSRGWKIGLSVSGPNQCDVLREAMKIKMVNGGRDERLFDSVQCTFNMMEQKAGESLKEAHDAGMDIIIKEGLANGRVLRHPLLMDICNRSGLWQEDAVVTPDRLALACILVQPFEPRVLSGAVTPEQLESNFQALELSEILKDMPDLVQEIMEGCVVPSDEYWNERSALSWN